MNQPTREEFEAFKEALRQEFREEQMHLKEEVRKLREQITEPITIPRISAFLPLAESSEILSSDTF